MRVTNALLLAGSAVAAAENVTLVTFDGASGTTFKWTAENDPVMGGLSRSTFTIKDNVGVFDGEVKDVPSLKAPGFCFLHTEGVKKFHSAEGQTHLELTLRNAGESADFVAYKASFAANTLDPQFKNFKADFNLTADAKDFTTVHIPFTRFSNKWLPQTGEPTKTCQEDKSACVTQEDLKDIYQFAVWAEGKKGTFHLEMQSVRAVTLEEGSTKVKAEELEVVVVGEQEQGDWNNTCTKRAEKSLRWNVTVAGAQVQLPFAPGLPKDESFSDAICCDPIFRPFAEPENFFQQADVDLFAKLDSTKETVFYDSVCGEPLFSAPRNRTFKEWHDESNEHGWPSFRDAEVLPGAMTVDKVTGFVFSKCGTHLGSYLPDSVGDRYCLDLACLSGMPPSYSVIN